MSELTVAIGAKLMKDGANSIDLFVHSFYVGQVSPCVVIEDHIKSKLIGGNINSVDEIFLAELAKHPGYTVKDTQRIIATNPNL